MAYRLDPYDNSIVVSGFENGIADNPFDGISDMKNVNIISVPGEASVNFSTSSRTPPIITNASAANLFAATSDVFSSTGSTGLENGMCISFSVLNGLTGFVINTPYWVTNVGINGPGTFRLSLNFERSSTQSYTLAGTGTFSTYNMSTPKHFVKELGLVAVTNDASYWMVDSAGLVWTNRLTTTSGYWIYTGNTVGTANGNGLVAYAGSDSSAYMFVFENSRINYTQTCTSSASTAVSWVYGWKPLDGTTTNAAGYLNTGASINNSHEAMLMPNGQVQYCDANFIGRFYQASLLPGATTFNPTTKASYVFDQNPIPSLGDTAQCLTYMGTNTFIGGRYNIIYVWDGFSTTYSYQIFLAESNVVKMVTVNTNTFILVGNRGRIYVTNGAQAQLYKKVPDHLSGTVEPNFIWGGLTSVKNQLYFGCYAVDNASASSLDFYGGLWAIDLDTKAIRLTNKLSYGAYTGYASALIPRYFVNVSNVGAGLLIGWNTGQTNIAGIDTTVATPYTGSQATIDSDLIPIGTFQKTRDFERVEYKLTKPMVSGESVKIQYRLDFSQSYTDILTDSTIGNFSSNGAVNFKNAQWLQLRAVLNTTASSPSYTRLKEFRIIGLKQ